MVQRAPAARTAHAPHPPAPQPRYVLPWWRALRHDAATSPRPMSRRRFPHNTRATDGAHASIPCSIFVTPGLAGIFAGCDAANGTINPYAGQRVVRKVCSMQFRGFPPNTCWASYKRRT